MLPHLMKFCACHGPPGKVTKPKFRRACHGHGEVSIWSKPYSIIHGLHSQWSTIPFGDNYGYQWWCRQSAPLPSCGWFPGLSGSIMKHAPLSHVSAHARYDLLLHCFTGGIFPDIYIIDVGYGRYLGSFIPKYCAYAEPPLGRQRFRASLPLASTRVNN